MSFTNQILMNLGGIANNMEAYVMGGLIVFTYVWIIFIDK